MLAPFQKKSVGCKWNWKVLRRKCRANNKNFNFESFFLYDRAKNRPPNLGFWAVATIYFRIILAPFQKKNQMDASEIGKCWGNNVGQTTKIFFKSFFLYDRAENRPPQPRFLSCCYNLLSNYTCAFSEKNQMDASETGKCWGNNVGQTTKIFILNHFSIWSSKKSTPPT